MIFTLLTSLHELVGSSSMVEDSPTGRASIDWWSQLSVAGLADRCTRR
jgi:hypothetical protein